MRVHISKGNAKINRTMNVSLTPIASCIPDAPCKNDCYACHGRCAMPSVRKAWAENLSMYRRKTGKYFAAIESAIVRWSPAFFRWHVGGDMPTPEYWHNVRRIAIQYPGTRFLVFTKQYDFHYVDLPENLSVVFSAWPGYRRPPRKRSIAGIAWMQDGTENRVPVDAIECPGSCETCGMCWDLKNLGRDVVFHKH